VTSTPLTRVLVTGGAGFIGCALSHKMAASAERWVALDSLHPQVHGDVKRPHELHEAAELVVGDVTDSAVWEALLEGFSPDIVIHLAAETGTAQSLNEASRHSLVNVVGTTEMTDAFGRAEMLPRHMLLSSSRAVYGEGLWRAADGTTFSPGQRSHAQFEKAQWDFAGATPLPSSFGATTPAPTSVYGATKLAQENILSAWASARGVPLTVLRLQNVYGPGQSLINSYTGIVSLFSQLARDKKSIPLYEDGKIIRDFVYIEDVADAFVAAIAAPPAERDSFDVGSGVDSTIEDLAVAIAAYHSAPEPHLTGAYRDGDVRHASCSITATLDGLDWCPQWSLQAGVAALQQWIERELTREAT
jgi:dTDP-L-rhamnose 4-epimerase